METIALPSRISRVDSRYRHWAQDVSPQGKAVQRPRREEEEQEEALLHDSLDEPLLLREQKGRAVMGRAHRLFHRRAEQKTSRTLTVKVEVVATLDASGNIIGQETATASIPQVPAVPTDPLPSVPAVPPFPSDLTVPAYPWPSGVPTGVAGGSGTQVVISPAPTSTALPSSAGFNSTIPSTITLGTSFSSARNSTSTSSSSSSRSSSRPSTSSTRTSTSSTSVPSSSFSSAATSTSAYGGGGGGGNPENTAPPPAATTTAAVTNAGSDGSSPLGTPQVVGTVFGSLAGAALLLALILFLIRRHKRAQRGATQLTGDDSTDNQPITQSAARTSFIPPSFLNRFSGASRSTVGSSGTGERGFQRISGRKLPSAFSEGITSEQIARGEGTMSGSSFYRDDKGLYGGPGIVPKDFGKETEPPSSSGAVGLKETLMPSPARTPIIHHPDDAPPFGTSRNGGGSTLSPPHTPNPDFPPRGTLGRSHPSHDGSRSSRFTENV
ncbi:hypothetical protein BU26DRAFT_318572 [Trematosphaeria pertusa]|uniref:Uncharacterized protein n=1 Tax=Trematosphaeria pertusa TaxID=390896 RepID=A0A6A6IHE2_9PLEO|nr:uncharacterized protein BU26DRAFT_318572 [Trematosphaeria pertusa]KAF2249468.1 hypothetical protein BU26DRAFT_318572 [Trematosphaeria pertusa]